MKIITKQIIFILCFTILFNMGHAQSGTHSVDVKSFGAKGDGITDDSKAIISAINAGDIIVFPKGRYLIAGTLHLNNLNNKHIIARNAIILNNNNNAPSIVISNANNITIEGGTWTRTVLPDKIGAQNNEHTFTFIAIKGLTVTGIHIIGSPQMGICMMNVIGAKIDHNTIEKCFRDGIYSHYSADLVYSNNHLKDIKDDAMSVHDYGIPAQKTIIMNAGFQQAGHAKIFNNVVTNAYQGISSIGCDNLLIEGNNISNTVGAGIAVFNSLTLSKGTTATVKNVVIKNNTLNYSGGTTKIMAGSYDNNGQLSSGRSALYVTAEDESNLILHPINRISNVVITGNVITNSYVNGAYIAQVDGLVFENNSFTDCDISRSRFSGRIVEIKNCTGASIFNNTVIDDRRKPLHDAGYDLTNVTGKVGNWTVKGHIDPVAGYMSGVHP